MHDSGTGCDTINYCLRVLSSGSQWEVSNFNLSTHFGLRWDSWIEHHAPQASLGAHQHHEVPEVPGQGGSGWEHDAISRPGNPLARTWQLWSAGGEEEAGSRVERLLGGLVVEREVETAVVLETSGSARRDVGQAGKVGQQGVLGAGAVVEAAARWGHWHGTAGDGSEKEEEEKEEGETLGCWRTHGWDGKAATDQDINDRVCICTTSYGPGQA